ncbi:MAG: hypothetical protein AAGA32_08995 [Pseudomonadota bacterium]
MRLFSLGIAVAVLLGCSNNTPVEPDPVPDPAPEVSRRALLPSFDEVVPEPALRGLILRVEATAPTLGYGRAALLPVGDGRPDADGIVTYQLRALAPPAPGTVGPASARRLIAATFVSDARLDDIQGFRIISQTREIVIRR